MSQRCITVYKCERCEREQSVATDLVSPATGLPHDWTAVVGEELCPECTKSYREWWRNRPLEETLKDIARGDS